MIWVLTSLAVLVIALFIFKIWWFIVAWFAIWFLGHLGRQLPIRWQRNWRSR